MGGTVALWGASSLIKSIQTGTANTNASVTGTATITAVDLANSIILYGGDSQGNANPNLVVVFGHMALTNATTVTATQSGNFNATFAFTVVEFLPGVLRSVQSGTVTQTSTSTATTILSVNTAKSMVMFLGQVAGSGAPNSDTLVMKYALTNATTVTSTQDAFGGFISRFQVIEYF